MRCGFGESLADYGFQFFEKIHEPIILVDKSGRIQKMNEAGRKLFLVGHLNRFQAESFIAKNIIGHFKDQNRRRFLFSTTKNNIQIIATLIKDSQHVLIEVQR